jgi:UDP-N-acetylglucosamine 2-epimerase (non-hydrolysing)
MTRIVPGSRKRALLVYGTRPELIKLAPVVFALRERPTQFEVMTCNTGQHQEMVSQVEEVFGVHPTWNLDLMQPDQSLNDFSSRAISAVDGVLRKVRPDLVIVQGDTTTVMATSLAAFHLGVSLGHVESGLRTGDLTAPFPEEANRRISDLVADLKFTPTRLSEEALLAEGHDPNTVYLTGNTIVDALLWVSGRLPEEPQVDEVLVTLHRRETFGETMSGILQAFRKLSASFPDTSWVFPVHKNPNIQRPVFEILGGLRNVALCDPMPYDQFIRHLRRARLVLTDTKGNCGSDIPATE